MDSCPLRDDGPLESSYSSYVVIGRSMAQMTSHGRMGQAMSEGSVNGVEVMAQSALSSSPIYSLRELHVEREDDSLLLSGRVESFYHKQLAQEVVRAVAEGCRVVNSIDVT